jgi:hypothetical protein
MHVFMIRVIALMMEAVSTSETSVNTRLHGITSQKTAIFIEVVLIAYLSGTVVIIRNSCY